MKLVIKHTRNYKGEVKSEDGKIIMNLAQGFDSAGNMIGGTNVAIINRELYKADIEECRKQQDAFTAEMRKIEDELLGE